MIYIWILVLHYIYEMNMQYWNEDLGIKIPTIYFICDRKLSHISSSSIRDIQKLRGIKHL